ncbi:hypothetical protein NIES2135_15550 [Leptolyngbya boryana NIES-2135]|jgi:hypothetical protein|uniref:Uncharacterized protein n=1 Tax=Leptolyngbya boryana NIES-2135 TaxID=1973484 RepID=A0A1Z4JE33_LEPBY|nr:MULTISPECIES: hypothetical protein [Leptolyngbya]BAY54737.1 hypothetical protein NIES2135_15550 [Leptolyngbya boryana NIES-2135]MBD2365722.1 hypothetical protein [Leptolyngbya sp. FACHB-161]MBD2371902.1 hypothetical protein [Leptolyngbya sp. FACHB-238]MBD2396327.1 hypothetical protein [Leptolyngbya sp. FACHB-239]MBD2402849.1 hypothetical protein [Leptolyngbya sp. FACHB-402]
MKKDLRRIEDTLLQLNKRVPTLDTAPTPEPEPLPKPVSFDLHTKPPKVVEPEIAAPPSVKPAPSSDPKPLNLPKLKAPNFSSHRNAANPALASSLLAEMQVITESWHTELNQILRQIQDLYLEGPIVDGWLESHTGEPLGDLSTLRHAEVDRLMSYIEEICATPIPGTKDAPKAGYRLCGINADGQRWSYPCPTEQIPSLSLAIARYHKLRQLLDRKQTLENRLTGLAETLVIMHGQMQD